MDGFKAFWHANTLMIGIVTMVLAAGVAALEWGQVATVLAMISGTAFMWIGRSAPPVDDEEEEEA